jgi:hypothetical protein
MPLAFKYILAIYEACNPKIFRYWTQVCKISSLLRFACQRHEQDRGHVASCNGIVRTFFH